MKKQYQHKTFNLLVFLLFAFALQAQEKEKPELMVNIGYYISNNSVQYVQVKTQVKADNKLQPATKVVSQLYLDSIDEINLIAKITSNENGIAKTGLPISLQQIWNAGTHHKFIAVTKNLANKEDAITELEIAKAKILLDTLNVDGVRTAAVQVMFFENSAWLPASEVEVKIGVRRMGGILKIGEDESYTTDSLGQLNAEFKLDSLPANDSKGTIVLVASIDDNDKFGNLSIEKSVAWGSFYKRQNNFGERSLWATRMHTPIWLLVMAYSIIVAVWGVIIYLFVQFIKIKKLGKEKDVDAEKRFEPAKVLAAD